MVLIIGLGNPGIEYAYSRHNAGFMAIDRITADLGGSKYSKFSSEIIKAAIAGKTALLVKPLTYMNRTGGSVRSLINNYPDADRMLVIHDDLDIELGELRFKAGGGTAGHKGLESIVSSTSSRDFDRLRIGIGRPPGRKEASDYVLEDFSHSEAEELEFVLQKTKEAIEDYVSHGIEYAMNKYN